METAIPKMSLIAVRPQSSYHLNDIITYRYQNQPNNLITHRIIEIAKYKSGNLYVVKGDSNENIDNYPVSSQEIVGKVVLVLPKIGRLLEFGLNPIVLIGLFYIPLGLIAGKLIARLCLRESI